MYRVTLTDSCFPRIADGRIEKLTIGDMIRRQAVRYPNVVALKEFGPGGEVGRTWTYVQLLADAERLGRALASRHAPKSRITIFAGNSPEWIPMPGPSF